MSIIKRLFNPQCDHTNIEIVAIRDDMTAVYECKQCTKVVRPSEMDKTYRLDSKQSR